MALDEATPADLLLDQDRRIRRAGDQLRKRQLRIALATLDDLESGLRRLRPGSWGAASKQAAMVVVGQAVRTMAERQTLDLHSGLPEVTKMSAQDASRWLTTLDKHHLGSVRPLRFDSVEWWEQTDKRIGQVRLREFGRSFQRYGASAIEGVEDALAKRILTGETWDKARAEVWDATRHVVGDRQWMVDRIIRTEVSAAYNSTTLAALYEEDDMEDPMLKRLVATFDRVTGKDSVAVHGQTKPIKEKFQDPKGRLYDAPPNRPHDREIMVGWRKSYDQDMPDFVDETATAVDGDPEAPAWEPKEKFEPGPKMPVEDPVRLPEPIRPAADGAWIGQRILAVQAMRAATSIEIGHLQQARMTIGEGVANEHVVASSITYNAAIEARITALRQEVRELQAQELALGLAKRKGAEAARQRAAVGALPKPDPIASVPGPALEIAKPKAKPAPKPKAKPKAAAKPKPQPVIQAVDELEPQPYTLSPKQYLWHGTAKKDFKKLLGAVDDVDSAVLNLMGVDPKYMGTRKIDISSHATYGGKKKIEVTMVLDGGGVVTRQFLRNYDGKLVIRNEYFNKGSINEDGLGGKMLWRQVKFGRKYGFAEIETHAAGYGPAYMRDMGVSKSGFNGYYTWPRLGYESKIPDAARKYAARIEEIAKKPLAETKVSDLMRTPEGRDFWREYGVDLADARFDLSPGSTGSKVLEAYIRGKGIKP